MSDERELDRENTDPNDAPACQETRLPHGAPLSVLFWVEHEPDHEG